MSGVFSFTKNPSVFWCFLALLTVTSFCPWVFLLVRVANIVTIYIYISIYVYPLLSQFPWKMTNFKRFKRSSNHHFAVKFPGCILLVCRREKLPTVAAEKWLYRTEPDRSGVGWHSKFRSVTPDIFHYSQTTWTIQHGCRMCIYNTVYYLWFQQQQHTQDVACLHMHGSIYSMYT